MAATPYCPPVHRGLSILHLSAHLIVIDKPSGLLSVPGRGSGKEDCLARRVQAEFPDALMVHRLDLGTSGIVVMARGIEIQRQLSLQFENRRVRKRYQALVDGCWTAAAAGEIALAVGVGGPGQARRRVDSVGGRPSLTRYRLLDDGAMRGVARIELEPVTGRTHQLRVHMAAVGHPIIGDDFYGTPASLAKAARLMLHASLIEFDDPATGAPLRIECPPPF